MLARKVLAPKLLVGGPHQLPVAPHARQLELARLPAGMHRIRRRRARATRAPSSATSSSEEKKSAVLLRAPLRRLDCVEAATSMWLTDEMCLRAVLCLAKKVAAAAAPEHFLQHAPHKCTQQAKGTPQPDAGVEKFPSTAVAALAAVGQRTRSRRACRIPSPPCPSG